MNEKINDELINPEDLDKEGAITSGEEIDIEGEGDKEGEAFGVDEMRSKIDQLKVDYADEYVQKMKVDQYGEDELPPFRKWVKGVKASWGDFTIPEFQRELDKYVSLADKLAQEKGNREKVEAMRNLIKFFQSEIDQAQDSAQAA